MFNSGDVGIGTTAPTSLLHVAGQAKVTGNLQIGADAGKGNISYTTNTLTFSPHGAQSLSVVPAGLILGQAGQSYASTIQLRNEGTGTDYAAGDMTFISGRGTGAGVAGRFVFQTAAVQSSGTAAQPITTKMVILSNGNVGIATTTPTNLLSLGGDAARTIWMERSATTAATGNSLTLQSGGTKSGNTDQNGGDLVLSSGTATGTGSSNITFKTAPAGTTGTTDRAPATAMTILGNGNVGIGDANPSNVFNVTLPVGGRSTVNGTNMYASMAGGLGWYNPGNGQMMFGDMNTGNYLLFAGSGGSSLVGTWGLPANASLPADVYLGRAGTSGSEVSWKIGRTGTGTGQTVTAYTWLYANGAAPNLEMAANGYTFALRDGSFWNEGIDSVAMTILPTSGNVGIGTTAPNQGKLEVKGGTVCVDTDSDDSATSCIASESDIRLKKNIEVIPHALDTLGKLRGVLFDWRWDEFPAIADYKAIGRDAGVIAQEVEAAFPQGMGEELNGYKTVRYERLVPLLIESVKELKAANDNLAVKVEQQANEFAAYKAAHP